MDESPKTFAPELSAVGSKRWVGRLIVAVLAGAAIWNFVVALTVNAVVPGLARVMEGDPQSPLYLGKGDFNLPSLLAAILELCFALIAAILVTSWAQSMPKPARRRSASSGPSIVPVSSPLRDLTPTPSPKPAAPQPSNQPKAADPQFQAEPPPAKAEKPSKPKKVYYNLVGERVEEDDE